MFFVKSHLNDDTSLRIKITDENVYTHCPECGKEFPVDLNAFFGDEDFNLNHCGVLCEECSIDFIAGRMKMAYEEGEPE